MAKRLELIDEDDVLLPADYPDEDELPTNRLKSGNLASQPEASKTDLSVTGRLGSI